MDDKEKVEKELTKGGGGFWGSLVGAVPSVIEQFNYKKQTNDIAKAQADAAIAEANAKSSPEQTKKYLVWTVAIIAVAIILIVILNKKPTEE